MLLNRLIQVTRMISSRSRPQLGIIVTTIVIALILNLITYPQWMKFAKPDWVLLVIFYWSLALPNRISVGVGWIVGLVMDLLYYSVLGQHAISKAFVALIAAISHRRLRLYHLWQQCVVVFIVACVDIGFTVWIYNLTANTEIRLVYWQSALTTALLWPIVYNVLRILRHRSGIS